MLTVKDTDTVDVSYTCTHTHDKTHISLITFTNRFARPQYIYMYKMLSRVEFLKELRLRFTVRHLPYGLTFYLINKLQLVINIGSRNAKPRIRSQFNLRRFLCILT